MFDIPISQVSPPGLHISLGTYLKFFNILEDEAQHLDQMIAEKSSVGSVFTNIRNKIKNIYLSIEDKEQKIDLVRDAAANAIIRDPDQEQHIKDVYESRLKFLSEQISEKLAVIENLKKSDDYKECGPCEKVLDEILNSLTVQRQAYHGKSFIGNHVHVMLKPESIEKFFSTSSNEF